ncbi:MAG: IS3 family transposase, partial [Trebonia sp.]
DHVNRDFTAAAPGEKMVGDITYIPTWQGWAYLATVIDCCTKEVVGWAIDDNYKTPLIERAIEMAARNHDLASGAIFHSDRGSNYMSHDFAKTLKGLGIRHSVGRTGICYDNAMAESFNAALKNELVHRTQYPTRKHAYRDVVRYIEFWYNLKRRHSGLQYRSPRQVREEYLEPQHAT